MQEELGNPVWAALTSAHQHLAQKSGHVLRYPAEIAPFASVERSGVAVAGGDLLAEDSDIYFVGTLPELTGQGFQAFFSSVFQMVASRDFLPFEASAIFGEVELSVEDGVEMMELTDVAFPGFFRPRTAELGRYLGIRREGQLVAMAGERMRMPGLREISAVCTRPGYTGRGFAKHLVQRLMSSLGNDQAFLHVGTLNTRAIEIYRSLGFEVANTVEILHLSAHHR